MKTAEYRLIPISEITDKAREIAVAWIDNYVPHGSIMPEIAQKQKLASDIMNYAFEYSSEKDKEIERLKNLLQEAFDAGCDFAASYETGYHNAPNFTKWKKQQGL